MSAPSRTRLRRGLLYLARVLWLLFALSNLISMPFGVHAYYSRILATGRSAPAIARALTHLHLTAVQGALCFTVILGLASVVSLLLGALICWRLWGTSLELLGLLTSLYVKVGLGPFDLGPARISLAL